MHHCGYPTMLAAKAIQEQREDQRAEEGHLRQKKREEADFHLVKRGLASWHW
jgi:hypothetical protein